MNPHELRVNNLIHFTKENVDSEIGHHNLGILLSFPSSNDYEPIPLSEEWLIRFGFLLEDFNWYKNDSDDSFYISFESDYGFYVGATTYGYLKAILYVHQLQNLYFALTGKELTIEK